MLEKNLFYIQHLLNRWRFATNVKKFCLLNKASNDKSKKVGIKAKIVAINHTTQHGTEYKSLL